MQCILQACHPEPKLDHPGGHSTYQTRSHAHDACERVPWHVTSFTSALLFSVPNISKF